MLLLPVCGCGCVCQGENAVGPCFASDVVYGNLSSWSTTATALADGSALVTATVTRNSFLTRHFSFVVVCCSLLWCRGVKIRIEYENARNVYARNVERLLTKTQHMS